MIIMAIFIILLAISIVASNNFGDAINLIITLCLFVEDAFNLFLSEGDKPKMQFQIQKSNQIQSIERNKR